MQCSIDQSPAVQSLLTVARAAPRIPIYDDYLMGLGGDPG